MQIDESGNVDLGIDDKTCIRKLESTDQQRASAKLVQLRSVAG